jgi:hypothetical protein
MVRLAFLAPFIRFLLRLLVAAYTLASRDIAQVVAAQKCGLAETPNAVAPLATHTILARPALETFRADAVFLGKAAQQFECV